MTDLKKQMGCAVIEETAVRRIGIQKPDRLGKVSGGGKRDRNACRSERSCRKRAAAVLEEINEKVLDYNAHISAYNYSQHCNDIVARGLVFKPVSKRTASRKWDAFFASGISPEEKRKIHYSSFKWHLFSYEKVEAQKGDAADRAFDLCEKGAAYLFIQCTEEAWRIENAQLLTSADLSENYSFDKADVYIFDVKGKWAYARTHESNCGPYFLCTD